MVKTAKMISATEAGEKLDSLMEEAAESHEPIHIQGKRTTAVLISEQDWLSLEEMRYLQSIPGMVESIREAANTPISECIKEEDLEW